MTSGPARTTSLDDTFVPRRHLRNGHLMTIWCWGAPRRFPQLPPPEARLFRVTPDTRILAHCYWQAERRGRPTILALHGLEGSSEAHYMRGIADKALRAGYNAVLLNQRTCGGTEHLAPGLYNSGLTEDADHVIRELARTDGIDFIVVAGYSLGGNLALKLAGDYGSAPPPSLKGVCAVSPVAELEACVRALERRQNVVYQWNFVRGLKARMRRKVVHWPDLYDLTPLRRIRSVRAFDDAYTAPHFGFHGAEDYYHRQAAMRVIGRIAVPALIITAADDPFVPPEIFRDRTIASNPHITLRLTPHGGHCGFLAERDGHEDDGYWAERMIIRFVSMLNAQC